MMHMTTDLVDAIATSRRRGAERHRLIKAARRAQRARRARPRAPAASVAVKRVALGAMKR